MACDASLDFVVDGLMDFSERSESPKVHPGEFKTYDTTKLLCSDAEINFGLRVEEDQPAYTVTLALSSYHIKNEESGRVFHGCLKATIPVSVLEELHDFIGFLIKHPRLAD